MQVPLSWGKERQEMTGFYVFLAREIGHIRFGCVKMFDLLVNDRRGDGVTQDASVADASRCHVFLLLLS